MYSKDRSKQLGSYNGDSDGSSPTFGISISPWVLILAATVFLAPKILPVILKKR